MSRSFSDFFGFYEGPFKKTPDVEFFFPSSYHLDAVNMLNLMLDSREGFAVLTGEPGTGKSITLRKFISDLPHDVVFSYILFPNLSIEELLKAILSNFDLKFDNKASKVSCYQILHDFFIQMKEKGKKVLIIIDEAQNIPLNTLEELRILSNFETEKEKLVSIVLAGQTELVKRLEAQELRQLRQRISLWDSLSPLNKDECYYYINFRLKKAGTNMLTISKRMAKTVWRYTNGNPRLINTLMEKTVIAAYLAGEHKIKSKHLEAALNTLNLKKNIDFYGKIQAGFILLGVFIGILFGGYRVYKAKQEIDKSDTLIHSITLRDEAEVESDGVLADIESYDEVIEVIAENDSDSVDSISNDIPVIDYKKGTVWKTNNLNVRSEPSRTSYILTKLRSGTPVVIIDEIPDWYHVMLDDNTFGWVFQDYIMLSTH